ncbi:MAG: carbohydrate porin [Candidatus Ancaeobacter aquaticus]|nr:carbohydrate porin [Candidatus Ancaeobacter aquaticus]
MKKYVLGAMFVGICFIGVSVSGVSADVKYEPQESPVEACDHVDTQKQKEDTGSETMQDIFDSASDETMPNKLTGVNEAVNDSIDGVDAEKPAEDDYEFIWSPTVPNIKQDASPWFNPVTTPAFEWKNMTGNWWGARDKLKKDGITVLSSYVGDMNSNVVGGRMKGARYNHSIGADFNADLEKILQLKGLQFHVSGIYRAGRNLSSDVIGNTFTVSSIFGSEQVRLYSLYFEQDMFDEKVNVKVGRLAAGDDFASSPLYWIFVSNAIDGNPIAVPINFPFSTYPTATWGARAKVHVTKNIQSLSGIYNGDPNVGRLSAHGMDFSLRLHRGILFLQELSYNPNTEKGAKGLPGHYKLCGYWHTGSAKDFYRDVKGGSYALSSLPAAEHKGHYGMYIHVDQMIYREGGPHNYQGLYPFAVLTLAPGDTNKFPLFIDAGVIYRGLIPSRDHDLAGVNIAYGKWSSDLRDHDRDIGLTPRAYEISIDFTYRVMVNDWMFVQPDAQFIIRPGGTGETPNALALTFRVGVTF